MFWNKNYVLLLSLLLVVILHQVNGLRPRNGNQFRTRALPKNVARTGFLSTPHLSDSGLVANQIVLCISSKNSIFVLLAEVVQFALSF